MISVDWKKSFLPVRRSEWFIGLGYFTIALVAMMLWLYALSSLAAKALASLAS
jgi:hypothetical protein